VSSSRHDVPGGETHGEELREASFGDLAKRLSADISTLVRQELDLARVEMTEKGKRAGFGLGLVGAAGVIGLAALGALTAFFVLVLDTFMAAWLAALIVAAVLGAIAAVLALRGRDKVTEATPPIPEQTVETVKEDVQWAKTQMRSDRR
jgi:uncharacterized membrane protein YqjE